MSKGDEMSDIERDNNEARSVQPQDAMERRALLLHLGDVVEAIGCVLKLSGRHKTIGEAAASEDSLADLPLLRFVAPELTPHDFAARAATAYFLWTKALLEATLNRKLLAHTVQHDLFAGDQPGWDAYVEMMKLQVPWFGDDLGPVSEAQAEPARTEIWPPAQTDNGDAGVPAHPVESTS
ncbi:hypothetical protein [Caballeronia sp. SL2Y3]|uniref:hypothetical protein n=1 Tax=Caballeronia sp. SL2Y3 TaxID=2878151 RepID=UPI001FD2CDC3|nr:hypothetical protein [Caballeronia sp. SL2Y3]